MKFTVKVFRFSFSKVSRPMSSSFATSCRQSITSFSLATDDSKASIHTQEKSSELFPLAACQPRTCLPAKRRPILEEVLEEFFTTDIAILRLDVVRRTSFAMLASWGPYNYRAIAYLHPCCRVHHRDAVHTCESQDQGHQAPSPFAAYVLRG